MPQRVTEDDVRRMLRHRGIHVRLGTPESLLERLRDAIEDDLIDCDDRGRPLQPASVTLSTQRVFYPSETQLQRQRVQRQLAVGAELAALAGAVAPTPKKPAAGGKRA